jgi:hypothetical protein
MQSFSCAGDEHPPAVCCGGQQRVCEGWQQEPASQAIPLGCRSGASVGKGRENAISLSKRDTYILSIEIRSAIKLESRIRNQSK